MARIGHSNARKNRLHRATLPPSSYRSIFYNVIHNSQCVVNEIHISRRRRPNWYRFCECTSVCLLVVLACEIFSRVHDGLHFLFRISKLRASAIRLSSQVTYAASIPVLMLSLGSFCVCRADCRTFPSEGETLSLVSSSLFVSSILLVPSEPRSVHAQPPDTTYVTSHAECILQLGSLGSLSA